MPANESFEYGVLQFMKLMIMLFYVAAYVPFLIIRFLGLEAWFVNTQTGVQGSQVLRWRLWRCSPEIFKESFG